MFYKTKFVKKSKVFSTWFLKSIFNKIQLYFINNVVLAHGWVKPTEIFTNQIPRQRIFLQAFVIREIFFLMSLSR